MDIQELNNALIGNTVFSLEVSDDLEILRFNTNVYIEAWGDCCSQTWFADIIGVQSLLREKVVGCSILDNPPTDINDDRGKQEIDEAYGFEIRTNKGVCQIAYRNSSNGYYGGGASVIVVKDDDTRSLLSHINWRNIAKDWSA